MSQSVEFHILMYGKRKQLEGMTLFIILNLPLYNFACWKQIQNVHILRTNNLNEFNYYAVNIINKMANMRGRERCSLRSRSVRSVLRRPNLSNREVYLPCNFVECCILIPSDLTFELRDFITSRGFLV